MSEKTAEKKEKALIFKFKKIIEKLPHTLNSLIDEIRDEWSNIYGSNILKKPKSIQSDPNTFINASMRETRDSEKNTMQTRQLDRRQHSLLQTRWHLYRRPVDVISYCLH